MSIIGSVLMAAKSASAIKSFVDSKDFGSLLADIELNAAARAISNLSKTVDTRSQVWNVVNHLETAISITLHCLKNEKKVGWVVTQGEINYEISENKLRLYHCLLAVCYAFLGESVLCRQSLATAKRSHELVKQYIGMWNLLKVPTRLMSLVPAVIYTGITDWKAGKKYAVSFEQLATLENDLNSVFG